MRKHLYFSILLHVIYLRIEYENENLNSQKTRGMPKQFLVQIDCTRKCVVPTSNAISKFLHTL